MLNRERRCGILIGYSSLKGVTLVAPKIAVFEHLALPPKRLKERTNRMTGRDTIVICSRAVATLLTVSALAEASYLPTSLYSFFHYADQGTSSSAAMQYWHHHYLMALGF